MANRKDDLTHQRIMSMVEQSGYAELAPKPPFRIGKGAKLVLAGLAVIVLVELPQPVPWKWGNLFAGNAQADDKPSVLVDFAVQRRCDSRPSDLYL